MIRIKPTISDTYANPSPSKPHVAVVAGEEIDVLDEMVDVIQHCDPDCEVLGNSAEFAPIPSDDDDGGDDQAAIDALVDAHDAKALKAACKANNLDTKGKKADLAARLVAAGITELE